MKFPAFLCLPNLLMINKIGYQFNMFIDPDKAGAISRKAPFYCLVSALARLS